MESNKGNLPVVEARHEYTKTLRNVTKGVVLENMSNLLKESQEEAEKNDALAIFQRRLKNVPHWSSAYVDNEVNKVRKNCPWLVELLTAVIITSVKILTSVKVSNTKKKIQIKTPQAEKFLHQVYIEFARALFEHIKKRKEIPNDTEMDHHFDQALDSVIQDNLPIQNILQMYVGDNDSDEESDDESEQADEEDNEDEDNEEDNEEEGGFDDGENGPVVVEETPFDGPPQVPMMSDLPMNPAVSQEPQNSTPQGNTFFDPPPTQEETEVKHVDLSGGNNPPQPQQPPADEKRKMLFSDAAPDPPDPKPGQE